jgi:hypothetical protein
MLPFPANILHIVALLQRQRSCCRRPRSSNNNHLRRHSQLQDSMIETGSCQQQRIGKRAVLEEEWKDDDENDDGRTLWDLSSNATVATTSSSLTVKRSNVRWPSSVALVPPPPAAPGQPAAATATTTSNGKFFTIAQFVAENNLALLTIFEQDREWILSNIRSIVQCAELQSHFGNRDAAIVDEFRRQVQLRQHHVKGPPPTAEHDGVAPAGRSNSSDIQAATHLHNTKDTASTTSSSMPQQQQDSMQKDLNVKNDGSVNDNTVAETTAPMTATKMDDALSVTNATTASANNCICQQLHLFTDVKGSPRHFMRGVLIIYG